MRVTLRHGRRKRAALLKGAARRALLFASLTLLFASLLAPFVPAPAAGAAPPESAAAPQAQPSTNAPSRSQPPSANPAPARTDAGRALNPPRATTLSEYRVRVRECGAPLEDLASVYELVVESEKYEVWSKEGFNSDFIDELPQKEEATYGKVRSLLPAKERVGWADGSFVEVDNSWLHTGLDESVQGGYDKRAQALRAVAGRLRSLEARLAELEGGGTEAIDRDAERGRLNAILRGPEFSRDARRQQQGGALQRLIERFAEWLRDLFPKGPFITPGESPRASTLTQVVIIALCLVVLAHIARRFWLRRGYKVRQLRLKRGARVILGERLEADQTASDLLDDAERLARGGDLRGAIRKAYVALLCELGDRGVVRLSQHKTNRDYLNAVRRAARPGLYNELLPITSDFEVHWYGLRDASDADWESFKTRCRKALKEVVSRE